MSTFMKFLPLVVLVLNALGTALAPSLASFWGAHASAASIIGSVVAAVLYFLPPPHK